MISRNSENFEILLKPLWIDSWRSYRRRFSPWLGRADAGMRAGIPTKRRVAEVAEEIAESGFDSSSALLSANSAPLRFVRHQNDAGKVNSLPEAVEPQISRRSLIF